MLKLNLQHYDHLMEKAEFVGKDPDAWKDWRQKNKEMAEDEKVR